MTLRLFGRRPVYHSARLPHGSWSLPGGALAREILELIERNGWAHIELRCLPAKLHLRPELITDAVASAVLEGGKSYDDIFVAYADCGTGGRLERRCRELGVTMIAGPHCYSFSKETTRFWNVLKTR